MKLPEQFAGLVIVGRLESQRRYTSKDDEHMWTGKLGVGGMQPEELRAPEQLARDLGLNGSVGERVALQVYPSIFQGRISAWQVTGRLGVETVAEPVKATAAASGNGR